MRDFGWVVLMDFDPRLVETLREYEDRRIAAGSGEFTGTVKVDAHTLGHLKLEGNLGRFQVICDEPEERGGTDTGPSPLAYFLSGAAFCLMTQYARISIIEKMDVDSVMMKVRGHIDRSIEGAFEDVIYEIRVTGKDSPEKAKELARRAEAHCYVHNTLKKAVKITARVSLNGRHLITLQHTPR